MENVRRVFLVSRAFCVQFSSTHFEIPAAESTLWKVARYSRAARDIFQYLPTVSVPGLALQALILHYINKGGLKNQGCRGKQIGVVEASRYSANIRLPFPFNLPPSLCFSPSG